MRRHFARCMIAGIVALLPIGGAVLTVVYLENMLSESWRKEYFYFPGMGLLIVTLLLYVCGLFVTTFLGRWIWRQVDGLLDAVPMLGGLYQTLKQILGYGSGDDAVFQQVALVPSDDTGGVQIGLLTNRYEDGTCMVFLPGSPNPTAGRLVMIDGDRLKLVDAQVADAFKSLVAVGKAEPIR